MILLSEADATLEGPSFAVVITHDPALTAEADARAPWYHSKSTTVITEPIVRGRAAARNRAAFGARGQVIVFTTPTVTVTPGWEQALLRLFRETPVVIAGGGGAGRGGGCGEAFVAVRRPWFERVRGFDEQFVTTHEVDDLRAQAAKLHEPLSGLVDAGLIANDPWQPSPDPDDDVRFRAKWGLQ